ncbi:MAG: class I SAM-dependent methyltransferase [Candidatus Binatia bacterium]
MANDEQARYWNEQAGLKWVAMQELLDAQLQGYGAAAARAAAIEPAERVLDVGCGCGATTLALAEQVGEKGFVLGLDLSEPMLQRARERAREQGKTNIRFLAADAQSHDFGEDRFDVVFSRFGVMFFDEPVSAFSNLAQALTPAGRVAFICWQGIDRNPWMRVPTLAAAEHVEIQVPTDPFAPGPFAFADADRVSGILDDAGLDDVRVEAFEPDVTLAGGGGLAEAATFITYLGPAGRALQEADDSVRAAVIESVTAAIEPYLKDGAVVMASAAWVVTARKNG